MSKTIKTFEDGSFLEYDYGNFDQWCVYLSRPNKKRIAPKDSQYFDYLTRLASEYTSKAIYDDYVKIYDLTKKDVSNDVLLSITDIAKSYGPNQLNVDIVFTILYLAMIAEENKAYTKLGKRIKRLGIYTLLLENRSVEYSANFMRKMKWQEIDALCRERGF